MLDEQIAAYDPLPASRGVNGASSAAAPKYQSR